LEIVFWLKKVNKTKSMYTLKGKKFGEWDCNLLLLKVLTREQTGKFNW
jgi:hypothetical protein